MQFGFPILNQSDSGDQSNESFWPSFTDIMMVIVMIFLIISVTLILRNWELVTNLRSTIAAEQAVEAQLTSSQRENMTLEERLADLEYQLSFSRIQVMKEKENDAQQKQKIKSLQQQVQQDQQQLQKFQTNLSSAIVDFNALKDKSSRQAIALENLRNKADDYAELEGENKKLIRESEDSQVRISASEEKRITAETKLASLEGELTELDAKYQKLLKPSRSSKNKTIVEVRYEKSGKSTSIRYRKKGGNFEYISRAELESRLGAMKGKHGTDLYVKLVIPKNSGLSYNEAYSFTNAILHKYDYYYQD